MGDPQGKRANRHAGGLIVLQSMGSLMSKWRAELRGVAILFFGHAGRLTVGVTVVVLCQSAVPVAAEYGALRPRFTDYRFDFSLVEDTDIPGQQVWLRSAETNVTDHDVPRFSCSLEDLFSGLP